MWVLFFLLFFTALFLLACMLVCLFVFSFVLEWHILRAKQQQQIFTKHCMNTALCTVHIIIIEYTFRLALCHLYHTSYNLEASASVHGACLHLWPLPTPFWRTWRDGFTIRAPCPQTWPHTLHMLYYSAALEGGMFQALIAMHMQRVAFL